ncbi:MAG: serine/threonine protein kinase, partial [Planctomycetota bacterium]
IQIGEALNHFHQQNWIHRDICPRNIMVADDKNVKLIDFGLAVPNTPDFRKPGNRTGTASYMAPELIKRQPTDQRIDIFSYAVTCFEMYTKRFPWDAALTIDAVLQHINKPPLPSTTLLPTIDQQIAAAIMKGLEANPDNRWQSVTDMVAEIREAEARLVKLAREAAAAKGLSLPRPTDPKPSGREKLAMPAASVPAKNETAASTEPDKGPETSGENPELKRPIRKPGKKTGSKKRKSDDDIDLNEMFGH